MSLSAIQIRSFFLSKKWQTILVRIGIFIPFSHVHTLMRSGQLPTASYFCADYDYAGKADLSKGLCNNYQEEGG